MGGGVFLEQASSFPSASPCRCPPPATPSKAPQCRLSHRGHPGLAGQHSCELLQLGAPGPGPQHAEPQQLLLDSEQQRAVAPGCLCQHHHGRGLQAPSRCGGHLVLGAGRPGAAGPLLWDQLVCTNAGPSCKFHSRQQTCHSVVVKGRDMGFEPRPDHSPTL